MLGSNFISRLLSWLAYLVEGVFCLGLPRISDEAGAQNSIFANWQNENSGLGRNNEPAELTVT